TITFTANGANNYTWTTTGMTSIQTNTDNPITYTPTIGSTVGSVTVTGANGTCTNSTVYTISIIPNPTVAISSESMCAGNSVTLTANNASTFTWSPATALNTTNGPNVIANPSVTTIYSVIGSSLGCNSQTQNSTASVVPNPTITINPAQPVICFGSNINLSAFGATNYTWSPNVALSTTNSPNTLASPTITTTYTVIGEQATCTNVAAVTVSVVNIPSISIVLDNPSICMNDFNGSDNIVGITASGASSYTWTGFNGLTTTSNLNGAIISATAIPPSIIGTGTVEGTVGSCTTSSTFSILIIPNPVITVSSASMCAGTSTILTANGASSYAWQGPNLSSSTGATVSASPVNTSIYSVIGTSLNCSSMSTPGTISVTPNPTVNISPLNPTICAGGSTNLYATGATNYTWIPGNYVNTPFSNNVLANPPVTTNFTVIGEAGTCTNSAIRQVIVIPSPSLMVTASRTVICEGESALINANGANSYSWTPNVGLNNVSGNFVDASPNTSITYTLFGNNGQCTASMEIPIIVLEKPVLNLATNPQKVCKGETASIVASGASHYIWAPSNDTTPTTNNIMYVTPETSTNYTIIGVNYSGTIACHMTQEILVDVVPQVTASITNSVELCEGESTKLLASGSDTYIWAPSTGLSNTLIANPYAQPIRTTVYTVQVSDGGYCGSSATVLVKVNPNPTVSAGVDLTYNADEQMFIYAKGTGTMKWIEGEGIICKDCPTSQIMPKNSGCYKVFTINEFGCKATDDVCITITYDYNLYIPNIFTPNYDGLNDLFQVYGTGITDLEISVFDRWGELLFKSSENELAWDGIYKNNMCKNDVYVYLVTFKSMDKKTHVKSGHVTLMK
ncbi:MAG: gliding motility-associated C-terminal domain-containing protein, partial [Bacteroidia bacterium]